MKNYKKAVLASLATIGASCALIGGATFALFTSDSTTNIAVTSGKVDVQAVVVEDSIVLKSMGEEMDETFEVGGTAEYVKDTNTFVIDGMVAGDYIEFDIEITNYSTVAVKYQSKVTYDGEKALFNALDFTIGDLEFATIGDEAFTSWENLAVGSEAIVKHVTMGIPEEYEDKIVNGDDTNSIQGKTCNITFNVTAVQGNAETSSLIIEEDTYYATDVDALTELRELINAGEDFSDKTIMLAKNLDVSGEVWTSIGSKEDGIYFNGTFDGNGYTITVGETKPVNEADDYDGLFGAVKDATIKNLTVEGTIDGQNIAGIAARVEGNTTFENCTNKATVSGTIKTGGIACAVVVNAGNTVQFINCSNEGNINGVKNGTGGIAGYVSGAGNVNISNCTNSGNITASQAYAGAAVGYVLNGDSKGYVNLTNTGKITPDTHTDSLKRYLWDEKTETLLCGYVGKPENWTSFDEIITLADQDSIWELLESDEANYIVATEDLHLSTFTVGDGKTLDLGGNALYTEYISALVNFKGTEGAVKNGTISFDGTNASTCILADIRDGAKVTFENVEFETNQMTGDGIKFYNGATVTFTDCTFTNVKLTVNATSGEYNLTFNGCDFIYTGDSITNAGSVRSFIDVTKSGITGTLELNDCTFSADDNTPANWIYLINGNTSATWGYKVIVNNVTYSGSSKINTTNGIKTLEGTFTQA